MAYPIQETPFLRGKDAKRFIKAMENPKKISKEEKEISRRNYETLKSIARF